MNTEENRGEEAMQYVLSIDQGTTGTKTILFDEDLNSICNSYFEHKQIFPKAGWVEHNPDEIIRNCLITVRDVLKKAKNYGINFSDIKAVGIANQGETVVVWDKDTGRPVYNAIVWQCRRTADMVEQLRKQRGITELIRKRTGLTLDSYFSASKIQWIIENVEGVRERLAQGKIIVGTLDSWIIWNLTGGKQHVTDPSTACRTMLYNINKFDWDCEIMKLFGLSREIFPRILPTSGYFGHTDKNIFFDLSIPITSSVVDQSGALFGHGCFSKGMTKCTYGTGCFIQMNIGDKPIINEDGILTSVAWQIDNHVNYVLDGGIYIAGAALKWLRDQLKIITSYREADEMAGRIKDTDDVFFVPAFCGLAAPIWDQYARGTIIGINLKTTREHIVRSTLESIAYQVKNVVDVMEDCSQQRISRLQVDGGVSKSEFLMQFQADLLGVSVTKAKNADVTAMGAALLAGIAIGIWNDIDEIKSKLRYEKDFIPQMDNERRTYLMSSWNEAVSRSKNWSNRLINQ